MGMDARSLLSHSAASALFSARARSSALELVKRCNSERGCGTKPSETEDMYAETAAAAAASPAISIQQVVAPRSNKKVVLRV